jgi:hypothetical protein
LLATALISLKLDGHNTIPLPIKERIQYLIFQSEGAVRHSFFLNQNPKEEVDFKTAY